MTKDVYTCDEGTCLAYHAFRVNIRWSSKARRHSGVRSSSVEGLTGTTKSGRRDLCTLHQVDDWAQGAPALRDSCEVVQSDSM